MKLEVIGAGFGRTGTETLKQALEILGFGPCYHMFEIDKRPDHIEKWEQARESSHFDFGDIFRDYRSAVDWPTCSYYDRLLQANPNAKVILTVRDSKDWYRSADKTVFRALRERETAGSEKTRRLRAMSANLILRDTFKGNIDDEDHCIRIFETHALQVKERVPTKSLLLYEVAQGWEPLCGFLGCDTPSADFPQSNSADTFEKRVFDQQDVAPNAPQSQAPSER